MEMFNSKSSSLVSNDVSIELDDGLEFYTPGSVVHGRVLIKNRMWHHMFVEVVIVCKEHAAIIENTGQDQQEVTSRQRRITVVGESIEGNSSSTSGTGEFPFELRIPDDPYMPTHLPSFEIEQQEDFDDDELKNFIRWRVSTRVILKKKMVDVSRDIVFVPTRPLLISTTQKLIRQDGIIPVYHLINDVAKPSSLTPQLKTMDSNIVGMIQVPESGLSQYPSTVPLKLMILMTHPHLIYFSQLSVTLISIAIANINGKTREHTVTESLCDPFLIHVSPESDMVDLSDHLSDIVIKDECSSFSGKWISVTHFLKVDVEIRSVHNKDATANFEIKAPVNILPPRELYDIVDAPPVYTQLVDCPAESIRMGADTEWDLEVHNHSRLVNEKVTSGN